MSLRIARAAFLEGYALGVGEERADLRVLEGLLHDVLSLDPLRRPFAVEGLGMALRIGDQRDPESLRADRTLELVPREWSLFLRLGVGCALAWLGEPPPGDPDALDGYGFQIGIGGAFDPVTPALGARLERGLGRAAWFRVDGDARACVALLNRRPPTAEAWRGVGTACVFAGDPHSVAAELLTLAGEHGEYVMEGARDALGLWRTLEGDHEPPRVREAARALGLP